MIEWFILGFSGGLVVGVIAGVVGLFTWATCQAVEDDDYADDND